MMPDSQPIALGIDVGGTFIKAGLVNAKGDVLARDFSPSEANGGPEHMVRRMAELAQRVGRNATSPIKGVGLGMPGTLSHREGIVLMPPNLPGWRNVPVASMLADLIGLPVSLENDANCAAIAEFVGGAGRGTRHLALLTLGTGVGGGVVIDGKLWRGADECAGELGHTIVQVGGRKCGCGQLGCLEAYASASSTAARAAEAIARGRSSSLSHLISVKGQLTSEDVLAASKAGDALAVDIWRETCQILAIACLNLHHLLNPDVIVLGGGMSAAGDDLLRPVVAMVRETGSRIVCKPPRICLAALGNDAGFIGAALEVLQ